VVHVVESLETGGLERFVCDLVEARHQQSPTSVICLEQLGALGESLVAKGHNVPVAGTGQGRWRALRRLAGMLRDIRPDIVHAHNFLAHRFTALAALAAGRPPIVFTKHGAGAPGGGPGGWLHRRLARTTQMVAVSRESLALLDRWRPPGSRPAIYIPNGIALARCQSSLDRRVVRSKNGWPEGALLAVMVARLAEPKDHSTLLRAWTVVRSRIPSAILLVVGDGPLRTTIESAINTMGLHEAVLMLGERHDIPEILRAADVFVLSSQSEGMPVTILEAMGAGLPVIASDVGGVAEVVEHGRTGWLAPAGSPEALAQAVMEMAADPDRAAAMGAAGLARARERFDLPAVLAAYERVYAEVQSRL
jgi:glycosyltransferase involved in cell wall biosynthesis